MIDIKFRAWDKKTKKMRKVESIGFGTLSLHKEEYPVINLKGRDCINNKDIIIHRDKNQYYLMQYTGLKDINGVEIYEGDILVFPNGKTRGEVFYCDGSFQLRSEIDVDILSAYCLNKMQVIGNIYENPELLGVDKNV